MLTVCLSPFLPLSFLTSVSSRTRSATSLHFGRHWQPHTFRIVLDVVDTPLRMPSGCLPGSKWESFSHQNTRPTLHDTALNWLASLISAASRITPNILVSHSRFKRPQKHFTFTVRRRCHHTRLPNAHSLIKFSWGIQASSITKDNLLTTFVNFQEYISIILFFPQIDIGSWCSPHHRQETTQWLRTRDSDCLVSRVGVVPCPYRSTVLLPMIGM